MLNLKQKQQQQRWIYPKQARFTGRIGPDLLESIYPLQGDQNPVGDGDWNPAPDDSPHDVEYGINKKR